MCTTISIQSNEGAVLGRTMEFGVNMDFATVVIPRNMNYAKDLNNNDLMSTYATVGSTYFKLNAYNDGVNEKGLMGCVNYFPGFAEYPKEQSNSKKISLAPEYFLTFILANCANIDEVINLVKQIELIDVPLKSFGQTLTLHYTVCDKQGRQIVIEPLNKELVIYDNPVGVMTNSPDFQWQLTNLRNYTQLQSANRNDNIFSNYKAIKFGEGTGLMGLPGDFTPPSRFVKASYFVSCTPKQKTYKEAIKKAFHILANFDIPYGSIYNPELDGYDVTQYTACVDSVSLSYYVHTIEDTTIRKISLEEIDLNSSEIMVYPMSMKQDYLPVN